MSSTLEKLGLCVKTLQWRHHRALDARMASLGTTLVQWNALREIDRNPGVSAHRLAELTFNSDQAFGTLTARLLRRGFIDREPGVGRAYTHRLTRSGKRLLTKGEDVMREVLAESFAPLDAEERKTLYGLMTKLVQHPGLREA